MKNNDISNRASPYVAFDIDSLLYHEEYDSGKSAWDKIKSFFSSNIDLYTKRPLNHSFTNYLRELYKKTEYNIVLLSRELTEAELEVLADRLDQEFVPFSNLYSYDTVESIRSFCTSESFMYFFSGDDNLLSEISAKNALPFYEAKVLLG